jgi:hypothetical protein
VTAKATNEPASEDDGILVIGDTPEEPKYDVLFRLRGKDYEGLTNPSGSLMMEYIGLLRKRGANVAISWLLEEMLTPEAYKALTGDRSVSRTDSRKVNDMLLGLMFGGADIPKSQRNG